MPSSILKIMMPFGIFINNLADGIQNGLITFTNDIKLNEDTLGTGLEFKKPEQIRDMIWKD